MQESFLHLTQSFSLDRRTMKFALHFLQQWWQRRDEENFSHIEERRRMSTLWKRICLRYNFMLGNDVKLREVLGRRWIRGLFEGSVSLDLKSKFSVWMNKTSDVTLSAFGNAWCHEISLNHVAWRNSRTHPATQQQRFMAILISPPSPYRHSICTKNIVHESAEGRAPLTWSIADS